MVAVSGNSNSNGTSNSDSNRNRDRNRNRKSNSETGAVSVEQFVSGTTVAGMRMAKAMAIAKA